MSARYPTIILEPGNHRVEDNRITVTGDQQVTVYTLPKGAKVIRMYDLGGGRKQLTLGGFKSSTVSVTGPADTIHELREAIL